MPQGPKIARGVEETSDGPRTALIGRKIFSISRTLSIVVVASCAFGCATKPPEATDKERSEVFDALFTCLQGAAKKLDDNRSDAASIALAMRPLCLSEFSRSRDIEGRRLNPAARQIYDRKDMEAFIQIATTVVLDERAKRRQNSN